MRKALGRGLDALIPTTPSAAQDNTPSDGVLRLPIDKIRANHLQPRKRFDPERLQELASSIRDHGLAQPVVVSYDKASDTYELIAGERRLRASELAGLREIEAVVRAPESDRKRLVLALVENLQREDLNPVEEALGFLRLMRENGISQTELAELVGKSKSAVSNTLRLLDLPEEVQKALQAGHITEGHARALLSANNSAEIKRIFYIVTERGLSVRETEDLARASSHGGGPAPRKARPYADKPADIKSLEISLQHSLGTKVEIRQQKDPTKGAILVHYYSLNDFERVINLLQRP